MKIIFLLLSTSLLFAETSEVPWLQRKAEGWVWFEKEKKKNEPKKEALPKKTEQPSPPIKNNKLTNKQQLDIIKKKIEEQLAQAILYPTAENVTIYMQMQDAMVKKSEVFANVWSKILLTHPELDTTLERPISQYGLAISQKIMKEQQEKQLKELGKKYMLFFFYESSCRFAKSFSKVIKEFCKIYNWKLLGITLDGQTLADIPTLQKTDKMMKHFNVKYTPAVMLFDPLTEESIPVGWGILAMSQLEENIIKQFEKEDFSYENK